MKVKLITLFTLSFLLIGGCNTMSGFGKDMKKAGEKIEQTAK